VPAWQAKESTHLHCQPAQATHCHDLIWCHGAFYLGFRHTKPRINLMCALVIFVSLFMTGYRETVDYSKLTPLAGRHPGLGNSLFPDSKSANNWDSGARLEVALLTAIFGGLGRSRTQADRGKWLIVSRFSFHFDKLNR
jgi:hypothetical protein